MDGFSGPQEAYRTLTDLRPASGELFGEMA
jgi:hypothetical protein